MADQQYDVSGNVFKREETTKELIVQVKSDNGNYINPNTAHDWVAKIANASGYLGNYPVTILGNQIKVASKEFSQLPADTYYLELWETWADNGVAQQTIYPSPGQFIQFTIEKNITDSKGEAAMQVSIDKIVTEIAGKAVQNISIDKVVMAASGTTPSVTKTATENGVVFTLTLPEGRPGKDAKQPDFTIEAEQLTPDKTATATITPNADKTSFAIKVGVPQGLQGEQGSPGIQGIPGPAGKNFEIVKTFASVKEMTDSKGDGLSDGDFVLIASTVGDADNAKLYVWDDTEFKYLVDLSGAQGIKGEQGVPGPASSFKGGTVTVLPPDATPTFDVVGKDGAYTINVGIPQGKTGDAGPAPVIKAGTVTKLAPDSQPTFNVSGSNGAYAINLGIPQGVAGTPGKTPTFKIGTVTQLSATQQPTCELVGDNGDYTINLGIPQGFVPVKGKDYWTDADQQKVKDDVTKTIGDAYTKAKSDIEDLIENGKW